MKGRVIDAARRQVLRMTDGLLTTPLVSWTWRGQGDIAFAGDLPDFRPVDRDAVREMMSGRYLLASKLFETGGLSPFTLDVDHPDWWNNLHSFSWLRHFRDCRDPGEKLFARTLVLDWIGREGRFAHDSWTLTLTSQRVLNWLKHLTLLVDGATPEQAKTIQRSLGAQVKSLSIRGTLAADPTETLFAAIGLLGAELCKRSDVPDVNIHVERLAGTLARQIGEDGLHLSRNPRLQLSLLTELASIRHAASRHGGPQAARLSAQIDRMHEALDALTLSSGELAYFNGCGQVPHDILVAVQANGPVAQRQSRLLGGYGIVRTGESVVIADSGLRPPAGFDAEAHAGALGFEFTCGSELIVGSCGPAPSDRPESQDLFRQTIAHAAPTIDDEDDPTPAGLRPKLELDMTEDTLIMVSSGYTERYGAEIERRLTLLSEGTTLVGQDRIMTTDGGTPQGRLAIRFHLAPGISVKHSTGDGIARLQLANGQVWSFLWEGADLYEDDSVRQSAYVGFNQTRQLVLECDVKRDTEVAWIFTLEQQ